MDTYLSDKRHYSQLLPKGDELCFDVGANAGRISEVLLELGHKVIAFEPQAECIRELKARCSPYKQRLQIEQVALGDTPGEAAMFVNEFSGLSSLKPAWAEKSSGTIQTPVSTLDMAIQRFGLPDYCKIDVEGWELRVLQGLSQPIPLISFEYHQHDGLMQDAYKCLDRLGSLARIKVNIVAGERSQLVLDDWLDANEFKAVFDRRFLGTEQFVYGDFYIRMV